MRPQGRSCGALPWTTTVSLSLPRSNSPIRKEVRLAIKLRTDCSLESLLRLRRVGHWLAPLRSGSRGPFKKFAYPRSLGKRAIPMPSTEPTSQINPSARAEHLNPLRLSKRPMGSGCSSYRGGLQVAEEVSFALRRDFVLFAGDFARRLRRSVGV